MKDMLFLLYGFTNFPHFDVKKSKIKKFFLAHQEKFGKYDLQNAFGKYYISSTRAFCSFYFALCLRHARGCHFYHALCVFRLASLTRVGRVGMGEGYCELTVITSGIIHTLFGGAGEKPTSFVVFVLSQSAGGLLSSSVTRFHDVACFLVVLHYKSDRL